MWASLSSPRTIVLGCLAIAVVATVAWWALDSGDKTNLKLPELAIDSPPDPRLTYPTIVRNVKPNVA